MDGKPGEHHGRELKVESAKVRAERIIAEELKHRRWTEEDLKKRAKSAPEKLAMAARLRRETMLTIPAIAARLRLGSWKSASSKIHHWRKRNESGNRGKTRV